MCDFPNMEVHYYLLYYINIIEFYMKLTMIQFLYRVLMCGLFNK